jgi:hypothetical protein
MILDYLALTRNETDPVTIATLKRKGWVERPEPPTIQDSQAVDWDGSTWAVRDLTAEEIATKNRKQWTAAEFLAKFTVGEMVGIITAARTDAEVELIKISLAVNTTIHSDNQQLIQSLAALVAKGLLTKQRRIEVLS